ncbi:YopT-type cysteine protease domain-containing protein [Endozoicomonas sp. Mp262]|uniref:YopT-type cysteine protease domain-containing protein n=1 Tax=Endozoicomonas sp. Mp262 TaxID=2919499 RepID=UPI0021D89449
MHVTELPTNSAPQKNTVSLPPPTYWEKLQENITSIGTQIRHIQAKDIPNGVCEGLVLSWTQSVLADDQGAFDKRIETLTTDPKEGWLFWGERYHNLGDAIRDARNMAKFTKQPLSKLDEDTQHLLEIPAFLDTIYLYYAPSLTELKDTLPIQSTQAISPYALPKALASSSPDESNHLSSQYTIHNLDHFSLVELLLSLCEDVSSIPNQQQVFKINSLDHTIALSIQDGKITLFDQNYLNTGGSTYTEFEEDEIDSLAIEILSRFHQTKNNNNLLCALEKISLQRNATTRNTESVADQVSSQ